MAQDLSLLGIEPQALKNEDLGEEDAKYLGHTVGLNKLLQDMEKQGKEYHDRIKLASLIIETSLRNVYGSPLSISYWSPLGSKIARIKMTNPALQLISYINIDFQEPSIDLIRYISTRIYGRTQVTSLDKLKTVIHEALEWASIPPNPQTPLFFNNQFNTCVFVDYHGMKIFKVDSIKSYGEDGLIPDWARVIADVWKENHTTAIYAPYRGEVLFTKLKAAVPKVSGIIVLDQQ